MQTLKLYNGIEMPQEGFGVFQVSNDVCESVVLEAIETGYRLIDTASSYNNETAVGGAIRKSGLPREDFLLPQKLLSMKWDMYRQKRLFNGHLII
ncbi:aldo/keto reductase [Phocaeicola sp. KGMB11183]|uniref:Aldo/keto reductase n=1 Tax=Phocaeicola acetigenes TaxID=3016083 RepID=A0ABT4PE81_9BACT|nr:aldo/keto reductase [Phocaeicola sp. KGMB11183]MCZ8371343.1 aldo/keto reductase [Phocaeicola sp. KGMB11183]